MQTAPRERSPIPGAREDHVATDMSVGAARERILAAFAPLPRVTRPLDDVLGMTIAEDVIARHDLPPFNNSAMDGFAVRSADAAAARTNGPITLTVQGQVAAGYTAEIGVQPGGAIRIMTGAPVPDGADAVIRVEETESRCTSTGELVTLKRSVCAGENIRPAGEDARRGDVVIRAGTTIRAAEIGLLAATGSSQVNVHRRPRVGVLVTGDEIVPSGEPLRAGQIWNSNGPMIAAQVRQSGGEPVVLGIAGDTPEAVLNKLASAENLDLLVTTGGVSVGDFDVVKDVLRQEGRIELWKLRMKPGKPLAFGWIGQTPVIGLPGNPVAAAVAFWQFGRPAIRKMLGASDLSLKTFRARLLDRVENRGGKEQYVRVDVELNDGGFVARLAGRQGSHILTSLANGNGLLIIPEDCPIAEPGMVFAVQMLD